MSEICFKIAVIVGVIIVIVFVLFVWTAACTAVAKKAFWLFHETRLDVEREAKIKGEETMSGDSAQKSVVENRRLRKVIAAALDVLNTFRTGPEFKAWDEAAQKAYVILQEGLEAHE